MSESIQLATILVTDMVGSTRLATTVGPVRADALRDEHFVLVREALAATGGQEFRNTGDGLVAAFGSATAAVQCAVAIQQRFERRNRRAEQSLHVRIGLGAGESTVQGDEYFGMPSIEAARLCAEAGVDGILISPTVRLLAGRLEAVEIESVGALQLKGIPDPVQAFSVRWAPLVDEMTDASHMTRWPLPPVLASVPRLSYVGRAAERERLEQARAASQSGVRRVTLLAGEPGIGKTRLAAYAARAAHSDRFFVCWGSCSEELTVAYQPWIAACAYLIEHAPLEVLEGYVSEYGGELTRLTPKLSRRIPETPPPQRTDPDTERFLLVSAISGLLAHISQVNAVCMVLDDFHWADGQSAALLKHVADALGHAALQLIVTYRDSDLTRAHPLTQTLADLRRVEGAERIRLGGLELDDVEQILSTTTGHELDEPQRRLAAEIATETGGNPFFVVEITRSLTETGDLISTRAQDVGPRAERATSVAVPPSVNEVVQRRVDRLGPDVRELLTTAAVIGRTFDLQLLAQLTEATDTQVLDRLEQAADASILTENDQPGSFSFTHALINQSIYQTISRTRRSRLHHQIALALETVCGSQPEPRLPELATHWHMAAAPVDSAKAADYAARAGRQALTELAPTIAIKWFTLALESLDDARDGAERCNALIGLGEAQRQAGDDTHRATLLEASRIAAVRQDPELAAAAVLANTRGQVSSIGEIDTERLRAIDQALMLDQFRTPARCARLLAIKATELQYEQDHGHRRALSGQSLELARTAGDPRALAEALKGACFALRAPDTLQRRIDIVAEFVELARNLDDPALEYWAAVHGTCVHLEAADMSAAVVSLEQLKRSVQRLAQPSFTSTARTLVGNWSLLHGDLATAEQLADQALQAGNAAGEGDARMRHALVLTQIRVHQGRGAEMVDLIRQWLDWYPEMSVWHAGLAEINCWLGQNGEAHAILRKASTDAFEHVAWNVLRSTTLALYANVASQTRDRDAAATLYRLIEPMSEQVATNVAVNLGHCRTYLGLLADVLGEDDLTDAHFAFACDFHERQQLLLWAARAHLGWAESLSRRQDQRCSEHAARALELARAHGYGAIEARVCPLLKLESPLRPTCQR